MMQKNRSQNGFTLIELMIVVAILGILAAIALPRYQAFTAKSLRTEAYVTVDAVRKAEISYFAENDVYAVPTSPLFYSQSLLKLGLQDISLPTPKAQYNIIGWNNLPPNENFLFLVAADIMNDGFPDDQVAIQMDAIFIPSKPQGVPFLLLDDIVN